MNQIKTCAELKVGDEVLLKRARKWRPIIRIVHSYGWFHVVVEGAGIFTWPIGDMRLDAWFKAIRRDGQVIWERGRSEA